MRLKVRNNAGVWMLTLILLSATLACSLTNRFTGRPPAGSPTAVIPEGVNRIVYAGTDGNIYTIDRNGESQAAITSDAIVNPQPGEQRSFNLYPTWSPDGKQIAFVELTSDGLAEINARMLVAPAGAPGQAVEIFSSDAYIPFYLYWSPDSQKVSFLSNGVEEEGLVLHLANADGSGSQHVGVGQPYYWAWSPDNQEIFIHTGGAAAQNPAARLAVITMQDPYDSREIELLPHSFQAPAWSPDGEQIAIAVEAAAVEADGGSSLVLAPRNGGEQQEITSVAGSTSFAWSPDGSLIAYTSAAAAGSHGEQELYVLDPDRPEEKKLLASGLIFGFFWAPDGKQLAVFKPSLDNEGTLSISTAQQEPTLTLSVQSVSVDGADTHILGSFNPTDDFLSLLPFYDQYQRSITLWSPDSRELVVAALDAQAQPGIYVIDALNGGAKRIADGDQAFWSWR